MDQLFDSTFPVLPYGGTSGWSGSDTSRQRATNQDQDGTTSARQQNVLDLLDHAGARGLTWKEANIKTGLHHGAISGVLSVLHKRNLVARLAEKRLACEVYVLNGFVQGRELSPYKPNASARLLVEVLNALAADIDSGNLNRAKHRIRQTLETFEEGTT